MKGIAIAIKKRINFAKNFREYNQLKMNNDKRIILAIALYAAVITMVLHTLTSEGHQRYNVAEEHTFKYNETEECKSGMVSITPLGVCSENECTEAAVDNGAGTISKFVKENATSLEVDDDAHS